MTESQKEFLFKSMLKDLGVSYTRRSGLINGSYTYDFTITKKSLFTFTNTYKIGHFVGTTENPEYYLYGMPETNRRIIDLLQEYFDIENVNIVMYDDNPMSYNY